MIEVPNRIKIGNVTYRVAQMTEKRMRKIAGIKKGETHYPMGQCIYARLHININETLPLDRMREVLLHEIVHAILFEAGLDHINTEQAVDGLTLVLRRFMNDNDLEWLLESKS